MNELEIYLQKQISWSRETFGEGRRTLGLIKHITKELTEIKQKPDDLSEWIDVIILALDGYWRHGGTPELLFSDLRNKQSKNFARKWPKPTSEDDPVEHDRSKDSIPDPQDQVFFGKLDDPIERLRMYLVHEDAFGEVGMPQDARVIITHTIARIEKLKEKLALAEEHRRCTNDRGVCG